MQMFDFAMQTQPVLLKKLLCKILLDFYTNEDDGSMIWGIFCFTQQCETRCGD